MKQSLVYLIRFKYHHSNILIKKNFCGFVAFVKSKYAVKLFYLADDDRQNFNKLHNWDSNLDR